jgi:hypothetical protein
LVEGGRLALWDITAGEPDAPDYPLPWADRAALSHLITSDELRAVVEASGFEIDMWEDLTDHAAATMQAILTLPPNPLGLHAFIPNFAGKVENLTRGLADGRLRAIRCIAEASKS